MAVATNLDWKAIAAGAVVTIVIGILCSVLGNILGLDYDSYGWIVFFWIIVIGAGVGGYQAAKRRLDTPLLHGAVTGAVSYVVVQIVALVINLAGGKDAPTVVQVIFNLLWLMVGGTIGGYIASWRAQKPPRPTA